MTSLLTAAPQAPQRNNGLFLFFQKTQTLQSRGVVTLFHLFTIAIYQRNCFDMQH